MPLAAAALIGRRVAGLTAAVPAFFGRPRTSNTSGAVA